MFRLALSRLRYAARTLEFRYRVRQWREGMRPKNGQLFPTQQDLARARAGHPHAPAVLGRRMELAQVIGKPLIAPYEVNDTGRSLASVFQEYEAGVFVNPNAVWRQAEKPDGWDRTPHYVFRTPLFSAHVSKIGDKVF